MDVQEIINRIEAGENQSAFSSLCESSICVKSALEELAPLYRALE